MNKYWNRFAAFLAAVTMALAGIPGVSRADDLSWDAGQASRILTFLADYGDTSCLSPAAVAALAAPMEPLAVEAEGVRVTLREIVYDGVWLYTAAELCALSPETVMVMPGSAWAEDPCSAEDPRSFLAAAEADRKRLLAVYAYPQEFDAVGEYFIEHATLNGGYALLSGACMNAGNEPVTITWGIQVYEVDPQTGKYTLLTALESDPLKVAPLTAVETKEYLIRGENTPFDSVLLIRTGLAAYVYPRVNGAPTGYHYAFRGFTPEGEEIPDGAAPVTNALALAELPEELLLESADEPGVRYHLYVNPGTE